MGNEHESANRKHLAEEARRGIERVEAVIHGRAADLEEEDDSPLDLVDEAEQWERWGRILREHDPATYRIVSKLVLSVAALATAPVEN